MIEKILANNRPRAFTEWLQELQGTGYSYEVVIDKGYISHVYVNSVDDGDWDLAYGRIRGSSGVVLKQKVFKPVIHNGKFKKDISESKGV